MEMSIEVRHLRYFLAVAELLHFTQAAERVGTAQPSLSQQIQSLEEMLGVELFRRSKRRVELTPAGEAFIPEARLVLLQLERAVYRAREIGGYRNGELILGSVWSGEVEVFPKLVPALRIREPEMRLTMRSLSTPELRKAIRTREVDLAFLRWDGEEETGIAHRAVLHEELLAIFPDHHLLVSKQMVSLGDLEGLPFISPAASQAPELKRVVQEVFSRAGYRLNEQQEAENILSNMTLVRMGLGFGVLPSHIRGLIIEGVRCCQIEGTPKIDLHVAWRCNDETRLEPVLRLLEQLFPNSPNTTG